MISEGSLSRLSAVKLALLARQAREQGSDLSLLRAEPMAIIGMGCRFPGGGSPEDFWQTLREGRDAITEVPADRWDWRKFCDLDPASHGSSVLRWGGFLSGIDTFDAAFFGISPREAANLDPQQRLFLEVAHEALDDAGLVRAHLAGKQVGVFVASYHNDYALEQFGALDAIDAYSGTGTSHSILANRLSYMLDLRGPSVSVDTACSASLVAMHLACESLRAGDSNIALVAGVTLMIAPAVSVGLSKWGFLAADGRCKTFDSRANGFVRGEGCGVLVLKRLADALADRDTIHGVVRGSAVNQDGRTSVLTAPSGLAQRAVVRAALAKGAVSPKQVSYVEAHGTGTALGDPIEVEALADVFGVDAPNRRIILGAVKTNIGHLEAAAGMAGMIKVLLAMRHEVIPPNLHFTALNPNIDAGERFEIPVVPQAWPRGADARIAGVSSFGFGGTNAHVVLEEPPADSVSRFMRSEADGALGVAPTAGGAAHLLALSARSERALADFAAAYRDHVRANPEVIGDICYSAALHRDHFEYRAAAFGADAEGVVSGLDMLARGDTPASGARGCVTAGQCPRIAFVFSGQGPQWWAMGRELRAEPVFTKALETCAAALEPHAGWSLIAELDRAENASRLGETEVAQPAIFAIQVALAALLADWGIMPDAVTGHSVGEIAAAHVAGALSLDDAARLVVRRGRIMQEATGLGRMAAVDLSEQDANVMAWASDGLLSLAAVNDPASCVLSGAAAALDAALAQLSARGAGARMLPVNYAFHSAQMTPFAARLADTLGDLLPTRAAIPMVSTVTGESIEGASLDARYWGRNLRDTVRFAAAIEHLADSGVTTFVEIAPHPVLSAAIAATCERRGVAATIAATMRRGRSERLALRACAAALYASGCKLRWPGLFPDGGTRVSLPSYPWQRTRHWLRETAVGQWSALQPAGGHPLLGRRIVSPALKGPLFETRISPSRPDFLRDHVVGGTVVVPGTAYVEIAMAAAAASATGTPRHSVRDMFWREPLALADDGERIVQCVTETNGDSLAFEIVSAPAQIDAADQVWTLHAGGSVVPIADAPVATLDLDAIRARCRAFLSADEIYSQHTARGIDFGPTFRAVARVWCGEAEVLAEIVTPESVVTSQGYGIHPALLDACIQPLAAIIANDPTGQNRTLLLSRGCDAVTLSGALPAGRLWSHATLRPGGDPENLIADIVVADSHAGVVLRVEGFRIARTAAAALTGRDAEDMYRTVWRESAAPSPGRPAGAWLVLADGAGLGVALATQLRGAGARVVVATAGSDIADHGYSWTVRPGSPEDMDRLVAAATPGGWRGVVHLWNLDVGSAACHAEALDRSALTGTGSVLHLAQALLRADATAAPLWLISRGASSAPAAQSIVPGQALQWGFARVLAAEHPELAVMRLDLDPAGGADHDVVFREIGAARTDEREMAWRSGIRYVPRLIRAPFDASAAGETATAGAVSNVRLVAGASHLIDDLTLQPQAPIAPGPGEIEIDVEASGLNFRDVLNALGLSPGGPMPLGGECAGQVTRVGAGVSDFKAGDRVMAFAPGSFASLVVVDARRAISVPQEITTTDAAGIPIAFLTAMYALQTLAGLRAGERVLIHAGAGGVGMAAIQVAQRAGAEIFATAGSPEKRRLLADLGVAHVMDSRTLDFAGEVDHITGGRGVDVVLNSLAGDFIACSFDVLGRGGRFIEMGKRDIWSAAHAARVRPDASYLPFDLAEVAVNDPTVVATLLGELKVAIETGLLRPLPTRSFPLADAAAAFRTMAQARHVGKLVLVHRAQDQVPRDQQSRDAAAMVRRDGSYLITGGLGAIGLTTAQRMAKRGAGRIVLVGRNPPGAEAREAIASITQGGSDVAVASIDIADADAVAALMRSLAESGPPVRGIVHAAGVLDDGVVIEQTWKRALRVLAPKATGAVLLAQHARNLPLDFFVCCSSAAGLFGSPGQSSYAAANAFLDALCDDLRRSGLPATSVQWGAWGGVGMAARQRAQHASRLSARGVREMSAAKALSAMERAVAAAMPTVAVMAVDWRAAALEDTPSRVLFAELLGVGVEKPSAAPAIATMTAQLVAAPQARRHAMLVEHVRSQALRVLGLDDATTVDVGRPLRELGLDSLTAIELRNALARSLGCTLPPMLAFDHPTLDALATDLARRLFANSSVATDTASAISQELAAIRDLSDADAEALLLAELGGGGR